MSPEQARGQALDYRSDVFSLGVVLYELLGGRRPFDRGTVADTLAAIVRDPAPPLPPPASVRADVAAALDATLQRCLRKVPEDRYQRTSELVADLNVARRRLESGPTTATAAITSRSALRVTPARVALVLGSVALVAAGIVLGPWSAQRLGLTRAASGTIGDAEASPSTWRPRQVTSGTGWEHDPVISPDGSMIAYVRTQGGNSDIWVVDVEGGEPLRLTTDPAEDSKPAWFPDGSALAYVSARDGGTSIWRLPRLGGSPTQLVSGGWDPSVSPDGTRIAYATTGPSGLARIAVAPLDDPTHARLLTGDADGGFNHEDPAWSPDGREICYSATRGLWLVPATGGPARVLTAGKADVEPEWSADGRFVYFSSYRDGNAAIWRVRLSDRRDERLTPGTGSERHPAMARHTLRLVYATSREDPDIVVHDLALNQSARLESARTELMPTIAPSGSAVVFTSDRLGGAWTLFRQALEGGRPKGTPQRLIDQDGTASHPSFSPDERFVAYCRVVEDPTGKTPGNRDIWTAPATGGRPVQLTAHPASDYQPAWAPDGSRIAFISDRSGNNQLWVRRVHDGRPVGEATQLTSGPRIVGALSWSPDASELAFLANDKETRAGVYVVATSGGKAPRRLAQNLEADRLVWEHQSGTLLLSGHFDGQGISLLRWDPRADRSLPSPQVRFGELPYLVDFDVSRDGRWLVHAEGRPYGNVWMVEPQRSRQ